jgi:hypothetical protein
MKNLPTYTEYVNEEAVKGTGYKDAVAANKTVTIITKLRKTDHAHAMSIATSMMNRASKHEHQTQDMRDAIKILKTWIDANKKSE